MIFKLRNTNLRSDGTNFFVRYIPSPPPSSSSSSQGSSSGGSSQGPNSVLACGFGSFADGQFISAGYYNNHEYYTYIDGATTWYLFYDTANTRYTISTVLSNGNTHYYNTSGYLSFNWSVSSGSLPVGDTYDYNLTSQCPASSSSGSSSGPGSIQGPNAILACGFGGFTDGQFTSAGYYNNYEYYTLIDGATTYYLYYNSGSANYSISTSLGGTVLYYNSSYTGSSWSISNGSSPGGDTYDYSITSQCPIQGPNAILACGFGSFNDGQFTSAGFYNNYEYYTLLDGATTWYLFYDNANARYTITTVLANGNSSYYNNYGYTSLDWIVSAGSIPGGDTYDYSLTSQCPPVSSSSSANSSAGSINGPNSILACGFGSISDGQFTSSGYYNGYEYYSFYDMGNMTTWYLYYDSMNANYAISNNLGGGTVYYTASSYIFNDWNIINGSSPGGDTYDYDLTSTCPSV